MTYWKVFSSARSTRLAIEGLYSGADAFLIGSSPALLDLDLRLLRAPGVFSVAINNAATIVEPQIFICMDTTKNFNTNIFTNPRVMKFINYSRHSEQIDGRKIRTFPNTVFFDFVVGEEGPMMSEFCRIEGPVPFWGSTFFSAIGVLYQLGFKRIFLIGCTFDTSKSSYAYDHHLDEDDRLKNQALYDDTVEKMKTLVPMLDDEGMSIITCQPNTSLDGICPYVEFDEAISECSRSATSLRFNEFINGESQ